MKRNIILACLALLILCGALVYFLKFRSPRINDGLISIKVADSKFMGLLPLYVADEKHIFEKYGIRLEWSEVSDPAQVEKVFLTGGTDLLVTTFASSLQSEIRQPGTLRFFLPTAETAAQSGSYLLLPPNSAIRSPEELRGKKIGTYAGLSQKAYLQIFMTKLGMTAEKDYQLVQVPSSAQIQGLFGGTYDALFTVEPYGSVAITEGATILIDGVRTKYIADPFWIGAFAVKSDLGADKVKMGKLSLAISEAVLLIKQDDALARDILAKRTGAKDSVAQRCRLYDWTVNPTEGDIAQMQNMIDMLTTEKLLEHSVEIKPLLIPNTNP